MRERPRSLLLFAFHFPPESLPGTARPYRFFKYLPEFGYVPEVITAAQQTEPRPRVHHVPAKTYYPNKYTPAGALEIALHKIAMPAELALLWGASAARAAAAILRTKRAAAVLSTSPPLNTQIAGLIVQARFGVPWIADFRDPLLGNSFRGVRSPIHRLADRAVESLIMRRADLIVGVTDTMVDNWRKQYPGHDSKFRLLWNGFDPGEDLYTPAAAARPYRVIAHIGSLYSTRSPMAPLNSLKRLIESGRVKPGALRIQLVGGFDTNAERDPDVIEYLTRRDSLEVLPFMPRAQALEYMLSAEYLMLLDLHQDQTSAYAVPSKLYEYIRVGRPMLVMTHPGTPVERIVLKSGIPHVLLYPDDGDAEMDAKIMRLAAIPPDPVMASDWFIDNFDGRKQAGALAEMLDELIDRQPVPAAEAVYR